MKTLSDLALPATIYRVSAVEKTIQEMQSDIALLRASLDKSIDQIKAGFVKKANLGVGKTPNEELLVPDELKLIKGKKYVKNGKTIFGQRGRNAELTAKRWELWKAQCAMGIPVSVIARAWGCDHASILHAKKKGFKAYAKQ